MQPLRASPVLGGSIEGQCGEKVVNRKKGGAESGGADAECDLKMRRV